MILLKDWAIGDSFLVYKHDVQCKNLRDRWKLETGNSGECVGKPGKMDDHGDINLVVLFCTYKF